MNKDLNEKINKEIGQDKQKYQKILEKNNIYNNITFSNVSTKETTVISSETEESFQVNKNNIRNALKEKLKRDTKNKETEIYYILKENDKKKNLAKKKVAKNDNYKSEYITEKINMNLKAPKVPINYNINFNMDRIINQKEIGDLEYVENIFRNKFKKSQDFKEISVISHDKLLHLFINEDIHYIKETKKKYNKISITERFKHKYLTMVYCFPKK